MARYSSWSREAADVRTWRILHEIEVRFPPIAEVGNVSSRYLLRLAFQSSPDNAVTRTAKAVM